MKINTYPVGEYGANCYLVINEDAKESIMIDPGAYGKTLEAYLKDSNTELKAILLTHGHFDHVGAVEELKNKYNVPVYIHEGEVENMDSGDHVYSKLPHFFNYVENGDSLQLAGLDIKCIHTPGHSKGGMCYLTGDSVFTGDTLFNGAIGRTDLISGSFQTLIHSIEERLMILDKETKVYPGHGPSSSIIYERMRNPYLNDSDY